MTQVANNPVSLGELEQEIKQLQRQLQQEKATSQYYKRRDTFHSELNAVSHKKLTGDEKWMIRALYVNYLTNSRKKPDENDEYLVFKNDTVFSNGEIKKGLANMDGQSVDACSDILKKLDKKGLIVHRVTKPTKENPKRRTYIRFTDKFCIEGFESLPEGNWGGNREQFKCKACGGKRCRIVIEKTTTKICEDCGTTETESKMRIIEPEPGEDENQDIEQTETTPKRPSHEYSEFDTPYVDSQIEPPLNQEPPLDEREQARIERVERERTLHKIGRQAYLEKWQLTEEDVRFTGKDISPSEPAPELIPTQEEPPLECPPGDEEPGNNVHSLTPLDTSPSLNGHHQEPERTLPLYPGEEPIGLGLCATCRWNEAKVKGDGFKDYCLKCWEEEKRKLMNERKRK